MPEGHYSTMSWPLSAGFYTLVMSLTLCMSSAGLRRGKALLNSLIDVAEAQVVVVVAADESHQQHSEDMHRSHNKLETITGSTDSVSRPWRSLNQPSRSC